MSRGSLTSWGITICSLNHAKNFSYDSLYISFDIKVFSDISSTFLFKILGMFIVGLSLMF